MIRHMLPIVLVALPALLVVCALAVARAEPPAQHPYLFFSAEDVPALRERVQRPPFLPRWQRLQQVANGLLESPPAQHQRMNLGNAGLLAFAYVITEDERYARRAIEEALYVASVERWEYGYRWNRGADLTISERSLAVALVYDWCHDAMTDAQRRTLRDALLQKGVEAYLRSLEPGRLDWWVGHEVNNWRGVCHGSAGVAALALYHESPRAREAARAAYEHVPALLRQVILEDGGGHEGVGYYNYGVVYATYAAAAQQRFFGGHDALFAELARQRLAGYWDLYMQGPDLYYANISRMGGRWQAGLWSQTGRSEGGPHSALAAFYESHVPGGDDLLRWAADNGGQRFYWRGVSPFFFLWRSDRPSLFQQPRPPLQPAVLFRGAGHAIFQSDSLWLAYSGGRVHTAEDLGAFVLVAGQERLIHLPPDREHTAAGLQSTVLVNGQGQVRGAQGRYTHFGFGPGFHYLASDLVDAYPRTPLRRFVRHVVIVGGRYVVLLDDLVADEPAAFEARLQSVRDVAVGETGGMVLGRRHALHVLSPGFDSVVCETGQSLSPKQNCLRLRPAHLVASQAMVTILYPTAVGEHAPQAQTTPDGTLRVTHADGTVDELVFREAPEGWRLMTVNGEGTAGLSMPEGRSLVPLRLDDGTKPLDDVPSWLTVSPR